MSSGGRTIVAILSVGLLLAASGIAEAAPAAETTLVSVHSDGTQGDDVSSFASISAHGRYVAFTSAASTLVTGDTNNGLDVFVHDRQTGTTTRVSLGLNGNQANGSSQEPSISAGGRYIAFYSGASNLVRGDTNRASDVFVYDRQTGTTSRVSLRSNGNQANRNSSVPSISGNGRYVAFYSNASNLVRGDTNDKFDAFVHDRQTGTTRRVSISSNGNQGNRSSYFPSISGDGRYVAFFSGASNLVRGDTNSRFDVFVRDRQTGTTRRVSVGPNGSQGNRVSGWPSISGDGQYVAFQSNASNLVPGDANNTYDLFVRGPLH
jgi:Tol biopolymer transport system component